MRTRLVIRIAIAAGLLGCMPLFAATFDVKTLIDTDNRRSTGCSVVTPGGIVNGIDVIVTTQGTVNGSTGNVTAVTRQTCTNAVLNQFGSATAVDGGWNVGVSTTGPTAGDVTVESHMGLDVLTWDNIGTPRFVFMTTSGLSSDVLLTPWSWGGGDIIMPHAARDRSMTPIAQRNILLDGGSTDWTGNVPLANGTAAPPVWRFISASAYAGMHDLFFNFKIHTNPAAPTAHDDNYALTTLGGTLTVATLGVLNNDNPNNQPITASLVDTTQHGTLSLAPDGGFTYVHDGSLASQDQFHYVAVGTTLSSNLATVTIDLPGTHPYAFTSADNVTFIAGQNNSFQVTVTGKPTPALSFTGDLPAGITFQDNGNGTGTLSGTPGPNTAGTYPLVFFAEKNKPHQASQNFTLTVTCPGVSVVNPVVTIGTAGVPFSQTFTQSGGATPVNFALNTGTLPPGLTLSAAGVLSGTPSGSGTFPITVKVTDSAGCTGVGPTYNLVITCHVVTVTNPVTSIGTVNTAFSQTFTQAGAIGGATFSLNSGTLPAGLTLSSAGVLSGTPTQAGSFPLTVKVLDGQGCGGVGPTYNLTIGCQTITVTNPATNTGTVNTAFSKTFTAGNTIGTVTFSLNSGTLPAGLTLSAAGVLSGTPTQTGSFPITVKATDANGCSGIGSTYTLIISCQVITVTNPATNTGTVNVAFSQTFTSGNAIAPVAFTLNSGTLPAGLTLSAAGVLSGMPTQTGSFPITVKATDANGCTGIGATYTLTINCQVITVNNPATSTGTVNVAFNQSFTTTNAIGSVTFTTASTLPAGLTLSAAGVLSGTPTQSGTFPIVVHAVDANGCSGNGPTYSLTINCQVITVNNPATTSGAVNVAFSQNFTATNGVGTLTFTTASTLPTGFTLAANGTLSGTTTQSGLFPIVVSVADANGCTGLGGTYNLVINQPPAITSGASTTFKVGQAGAFSVTTTGFPTGASMVISESGALPAGVTFVNNNDGTATLAGTPNAGTGGTYPITITANNGIAPNATQNFTLTVNQSPAITSGASTAFKVGSAGTFSVTTTGFPTGASMVISQTGVLPGGVTFVDNGDGTATLAGTPNAGTGGTYPLTITANNGVTPNATQNFTLTVQQAPAITSGNGATFTAGSAGTFTVTTTGFPSGASMIIGETGSLPAGVTLVNNNDGTSTLSGTAGALTGGTYSITIGADNGVTPAAAQSFTLTVNDAPAITSGNSATFKVGQAGTFSVTTTAFPTDASMVISESGALPGGVTFVDNGDGTATLAGTPNALTGGTYPIVITANNGVAPNGTQNFTLTVQQAPAITSANQATFPPGTPTTFTVTTTGFPTGASMVISETGDPLPGTVTFVDNHDGTATLAGTATGSGDVNIVITANNGVTPNATQNFTLHRTQPPAITSPNTTTFQTGQAGTFTVTTTGFPTNVALSKTGTLPANVTFTDNGDGTATIAGTPNAGTGGSYPIVITGNNGVAPNATQNFTLVVNQPPAITSGASATFTVGAAGTFSVTTTGFPVNVALSKSGALPAGVTFTDNGNGTATLAGTPNAGTGGTYPIVITGNNGVAPNATQNFTLTVNQAPAITSANTTTFQTGQAGTFTVTTTGFPTAVALSKTGALPGGVTFTDNGDGTATIAGTPNAGTGGNYPIVITGNNGIAPNATQNFTLVVNQPPAITSGASATFTVGAAGTFSVTTTGFPTTVALSKTGALPAGVTFTDNGDGTATIAGTPAAATGGTYPIVITGNNGVTPSATQNFTLTVNQAPAIISANTTTFQTGQAGTFTVTTTGFPVNVALSKTGTLPANVTFTDNGDGTATIAGTPNAGTGGTYPIVITGNNGVAPNATQNFTLVVNQPPAITSANNATFKVGVAGTFSVTTTGFPSGAAMVISETGALPGGVTFVNNNDGTATLAGTPDPGTGGTYPLTIGANNGVTPPASQSFTLTVNQAPAITSANAVTFTTGQAGTFSVTTTGFPVNVALSKTGVLPASISFTDNGNGTATISGTPGPADGGSYPIVITGNNGVPPNATQNFTLTINQAPAITSANSVTFTQGVSGQTFTVTTTGFPTNGITRTGTLPAGVTFTDNGNNTATIAGTPAAGTAGGSPYAWVITAANGVGTDATQNFTFNVTCPVITVSRSGGGSFPAGIFNSAYTGQSVTASGGTGPYTFTLTSGSLPTGLSLASGGAISGTPTATGLFNFTVTATDTVSLCTGSQSFSISIAPVAVGDSYAAASHIVDNTQFVITGGATASPATPFVGSIANILANDLPSGTVTATPGTFATTGSGSVTLAADGTFIYTPGVHAGAITSDSFTYTVVSNGITSAAATVNLTLANRVWYVKNNGAAGNGQSQNPFNTLAAAQTASAIGDIIYVYNGDGLTTGQSLGITLKNNQQLIGEGVALVVNTVTLNAAGTQPQITNTTATSDVVTLADGDTVKGLTVTGATRDGIAGNTHAGFTGDTLTIQTSTNSGLHLTSMTGAVTLTNTTFSGSNGVGLEVNNGTATITLDATNSITANAGKRSVSIQNRPASAGLITIGAAITDNGTGILVNNNASGTIAFTGAQTLATTTNPGVTLTTNTGTTINFGGTLNVTTTTGSAFNATGGGTLSVTGTANVTTGAVAGSGVNINGVTVGASGVTFNSVNTTGATTGVSLTSLGNGNVTINSGTISGGTTGLSLNTLGTSTITLGANAQTLTLTGSTTAISGTTFGTLAVAGGSTVNVSGATALNLTTGAVSGTFANVTSGGGTNGVNLSAVTGTWGASAGALAGATGTTFNVTGGGSGTITWTPTITQANAANVVTISGSHTGTINFSGNVQTSGTSTGVSISASSGTYNFTGGTSTIAGTGGGITIFNESGSISFGSGFNISAATTSFKIGGTATNTTANITYSGTITNNVNGGVLLDINSASGTYSTGTITFNGTSLSGSVAGINGVRSAINSMTGTLVVNNLSLTSSNNNFANALVAISGTNTAGTITFNHLTLSANGSGHTGAGIVDSGTGGTVTVTGTGGASTFDTGGAALSLNGQAMGASAIGTLTCTAGPSSPNATCVSLTSVSGTLTISGGSITGSGGAAFLVNGGNATISDAGTIAQNTAGQRAVDIQNMTGGTVTLSGAIGSNGGSGVFLNADNGATINISGAITLNTGTANAFTATGGATMTVNATSASNSITTSSGAGITWSGGVVGSSTETFNTLTATTSGVPMSVANSGATNFTVGTVSSQTGTAVSITTATGDFVFTKISSNGAAKGITVSALTGGGSFTVNGTGGLCDSTHVSAADCTGGTIQGGTTRGGEFNNAVALTLNNMYFKGNGTTAVSTASGCVDANSSGASNVACNAALYLVNTTTAALNKIYLDGTGSADMGLNVNGVSALTVTGLEIANFTGNQKDAATLQNLTGTSTFTGLNVHNNSLAHNFFVTNTSGTANITFTSPTINTSPFSGSGNADGLQVDSYSTANVTVMATNINFNNLAGNSVSFQANSGSTMVATLNGGTSTLSNGILMQSTGNGTNLTYTVTNLSSVTTNPLGSNAITVGKANGTGGTTTGTVTNNTITSSPFDGINLNSYGVSGTSSVTVKGNSISNTNRAISATAGQGGSSFNVTIQGNTIGAPKPGTFAYAIDIVDGTQSGDSECLFLNLGDMSSGHTVPANKNNISTTGWQSGGNPIEAAMFNSTTFKMPNYAGANDAAAAAWITASNTIAGGLGTDAFHLGTNQFTAGASCP